MRMEVQDGAEAIEPPTRLLRPSAVTVRHVIRAAADHFRIKEMEVISARRSAPIVRCRHVAYHVARNLTPRSLPEIGSMFAGRDHSTIVHGLTKIDNLIKSGDAETNADIKEVERRAKALAASGEPLPPIDGRGNSPAERRQTQLDMILKAVADHFGMKVGALRLQTTAETVWRRDIATYILMSHTKAPAKSIAYTMQRGTNTLRAAFQRVVNRINSSDERMMNDLQSIFAELKAEGLWPPALR